MLLAKSPPGGGEFCITSEMTANAKLFCHRYLRM